MKSAKYFYFTWKDMHRLRPKQIPKVDLWKDMQDVFNTMQEKTEGSMLESSINIKQKN